jgi:hypothetical protein
LRDGGTKNKTMKENKLYKVFISLSIGVFLSLLAVSLIIFVEWGFEKYQDYKHPVKSGMILFNVMGEEDPFDKKDTIWIRVIQVKEGYVQYEYLNKEYRDTSSSRISYIRQFTPVDFKK